MAEAINAVVAFYDDGTFDYRDRSQIDQLHSHAHVKLFRFYVLRRFASSPLIALFLFRNNDMLGVRNVQNDLEPSAGGIVIRTADFPPSAPTATREHFIHCEGPAELNMDLPLGPETALLGMRNCFYLLKIDTTHRNVDLINELGRRADDQINDFFRMEEFPLPPIRGTY